ncbi:TatD family deoxyribonuclease [Candidatus Parcubacteria bacterium]|nr:MAG: TatD family deoxyribonuclease [Candidatus Parcubacteria bacterium]
MTQPKLIDTHAHVNFHDFKNDQDEVIKRALDEGVWMINVGAQRETSERAVKIAKKYEQGIFAAIGLHPSHLEDQQVDYQESGEEIKYKSRSEEFDHDLYLKLAKDEKVVAIGECGLDFHFRSENQAREKSKVQSFKVKQKEIFLKHIQLANEVRKPLIIHCRDAHDALIDMLQVTSFALQDRGVMHFFSGTLEQAKKYIDLGFYISFSGVITFPPLRRASANEYAEIVRQIPLEKILVETDCPYVAPVPRRGQKNEPSYVKYVAQKVAEIKGLSFDKVAGQTTKNARELFGI